MRDRHRLGFGEMEDILHTLGFLVFQIQQNLGLADVDDASAVLAVLQGEEVVQEVLNYLTYGNFISAVINFLILALVVFFLVRSLNKLAEMGKKKEAEAPADTDAPVDAPETADAGIVAAAALAAASAAVVFSKKRR